MSAEDDCREALFHQYSVTRAAQYQVTALRAALIEACGGDRFAAGKLALKHMERLEAARLPTVDKGEG